MRTGVLTALCLGFGLALASCDKKPEVPKGTSEAEVFALHEVAGNEQVKNVAVVLDLAAKEKLRTADDLIKPVPLLSVTDIVVNEEKDDHSGNARVMLLESALATSREEKLFKPGEAYRNFKSLKAIRPPNGFHILSSGEVLGRSARFLSEAPGENANAEYFEGYRAMLEEFVAMKYLVLLRTIAIKAPKEVKPGTFTPGVYGGQLMVFDLHKRELLGVLPIMTSNDEGEAFGGVGFDLAQQVEARVRETLAKAQGKAPQAEPSP